MAEYPLHAGARSAFRFTSILCFITIVGFPFGLWFLLGYLRARVLLGETSLEARGPMGGTKRFELADVDRVGVLSVRIVAGGIGGHFARKKVGGDHAIHLSVHLRSGKTVTFMVSMYEDYRAIVDEVSRRANVPVEQMKMGMMGPKWVDAARAG